MFGPRIIQVVLYLFASLNILLVMHRLCLAHLLRSFRPLLFSFSTPCLPKTLFQLSLSVPTEVTLNAEFVIGTGCSNNLVQLLVKNSLVFIWIYESWCIGTDSGDVPGLAAGKAELHEVFIYSSG